MKNSWQEFKPSEHFGLAQNKSIDLKLFNGKIISVYQVVGVTVLDGKNETISYKDIGWFRPKKDWNRYKLLQKANENISFFEQCDEYNNNRLFNLFNDLDYVLEDDRQELEQISIRLSELLIKAQQKIINESKTYL